MDSFADLNCGALLFRGVARFLDVERHPEESLTRDAPTRRCCLNTTNIFTTTSKIDY